MKINDFYFLPIKIVLLLWCSTASAVEAGLLISPGKCIGKVCINDAKNTVRAKLGLPYSKKILTDAYEVETWRSTKAKNMQHVFVVYNKGSVVDIHVTSDGFKTSDGISTQSSLNEARAKYSAGKEVEYSIFKTSHNRVDWVVKDQGITFTAVDDIEGRIVRIVVHRPGKEKALGYSEGDDWYWYPGGLAPVLPDRWYQLAKACFFSLNKRGDRYFKALCGCFVL